MEQVKKVNPNILCPVHYLDNWVIGKPLVEPDYTIVIKTGAPPDALALISR